MMIFQCYCDVCGKFEEEKKQFVPARSDIICGLLYSKLSEKDQIEDARVIFVQLSGLTSDRLPHI